MTDPHEAKFKEMQKYVPFIQRVIEKLKVNNDQQADNPRKAQLQKMEMLYDLLTNKHKKIKTETLIKCEGVLIKLQAKIEKQTTYLQNEDAILSDVNMKHQTSSKFSNKDTKDQEDIIGPASPPPEVIQVEDDDEPVVIPTERRCSPLLVKETFRISADKSSQLGKSENFQGLRKKAFDIDCKPGISKVSSSKQNSSQDKKESPLQKPHQSSYKSSTHDYHHGMESKQHKSFNHRTEKNNHLSKEINSDTSKPPAKEQKLQTVKVVITEPLSANFTKQHFPPTSKFLPRPSSVCHSNLRTLPQASPKKFELNEAYSPEESWDQYNESHNKPSNVKTPSTANVFSRLGAKVPEDSPKSKTSGRYTPIPDVLKSPPLSVSDINNLLLESGSDKTLNDISEIGTRRPPKTEDQQMASPNNSLEFVRKKLAHTAKLNSPQREKDDIKVSPLPNERLALKYNPHPRQERLQSVSSTDGSECSTQSKINDPRIKIQMSTSQHSPSQVAASNVNVLPAINLSDPRLKRQSTPQEGKHLLPTPPSFTPNIGFANQSPSIYSRRKDPRISRITNNDPSSSAITTPIRRMSTTQKQYSSEENWDTDEEEKPRPPIKSDQHKNDRSTSIERAHCIDSNVALPIRETLNQSHLQKNGPENYASSNKSCQQFNVNVKQATQKDQSLGKNEQNKPKNKLIPATTYTVPNAPKSDTEEDWDSEPEIKIIKPKPLITEVPPSPINSSPLIPGVSPFHPQISPKHLLSSKPFPTLTMPPTHLAHMPHIPHTPHVQPQYPPIGSNIHHSYRMQHPSLSNRFNSLLNDTSERTKYLEAKKQKSAEPRTYKEFREAKERERQRAEEAEAKKRANEINEVNKDITTNQSVNEQKVKQFEGSKKKEDNKKEKKPSHKEINKSLAGESTLDKMYRTQNFNTSFPKANTSFKIPKKKTDEKIKEEAEKTTEASATAEQNKILPKDNSEEKFKATQTDASSAKIKFDKQDSNKFDNINNKINQVENLDTSKQHEKSLTKDNTNEKVIPQTSTDSLLQKVSSQYPKPVIDKIKVKAESNEKIKQIENLDIYKQHEKSLSEDKSKKKDIPHISTDCPLQKAPLQLSKPIIDKEKDKTDLEKNAKEGSANKQTEKEKHEILNESKETHKEHLIENDFVEEDVKMNVRDPRCRAKTTATVTPEEVKENQEENLKTFGDIVITSSENQMVLKPQQNLEKFNKLTQQLSPQPQRILRRRNTMVVFDSAPLVDKEKLKKANALLFEDVQEEEKRKRREAEEERLNARRNKILEEMFKRTDDNCTVSTQNIITGKRRTRAAVNFNETANAINVFKHLTIKDIPTGNITSPPAIPQLVNTTPRSNFKIKLKNLSFADKQKDDESDDDEPLVRIVKKETKSKELLNLKESNGSKTKTMKEPQFEEGEKTDESEIETKINTKQTKKRSTINRNSTNNDAKFKTVLNEEHQNCAVSSTSTDNDHVEETTCSSTSTHKSLKKETDDNEPTSTASKSNNPAPTPEPNEPVLQEIVDQILKPNSNREPILAILAQILSEEKLALIKSLIESSNKQNEDEQTTKDLEETDKQKSAKENTNNKSRKMKTGEDEEEQEEGEEEEHKPTIRSRAGGEKKIMQPKKKRSELDRLNEDIRDMFICNGVLTATGRRMCTMMGKDIPSTSDKESIKESTPSATNKNKSDILKPPIATRTLRRSTRSCKTTEDNEDNESILSRTTEDSIDDFNSNVDSPGTDTTPIRKMPVLKPHTPIKIPDEVSANAPKLKETGNKRRLDTKAGVKAKKSKTNKDDTKQDSESDESDSEAEANEAEDEELETHKKETIIKNTNLHWHNQSKYATWCMICEKRIPFFSSSLHYKTFHRENYISRMAPVILQQYKQGKLSQPMFGVKKAQKQASWFYRCPFCLKYFNTALSLWLEHFQNHTVELRYECSKCYRPNNRKLNIIRHIKKCEEGATVLNSAIKLTVPTVINAHVCHLCNFIQLKRDNLERHYIEQHNLQKKTVDLLGYTIKLFDVANVECVSEEKAAEKEKEAWKSVEKNEQVIDIDDDDAVTTITSNNDSFEKELTAKNMETETSLKGGNEKETGDRLANRQERQDNLNKENAQNEALKASTEGTIEKPKPILRKSTKMQTNKLNQQEETNKTPNEQKKLTKPQKKKGKNKINPNLNDNQSNDFEVIDQEVTVQDIQDELLALAAKAAEKEEEGSPMSLEVNEEETPASLSNDRGKINETNKETMKLTSAYNTASQPQTTMSDIISSSIDLIYNRDGNSSEPKKVRQAASNVFMPTRDENNYSPTIQILAQSIINIDEQENQCVIEKSITMAERLSQRFKNLQGDGTSIEKLNNCSKTTRSENAFEKLIDETLFELTKEKDCASKNSSNKAAANTPVTEQPKENVFDKLFSDTVLELEKDDIHTSDNQLIQPQESEEISKNLPPQTVPITVISDDEDWEDIEITETAPTVSTTASAGSVQKSKSKGLFQKFGIFKGNTTKSKKHLAPMVFLPKKKTKEKSSPATTLPHSPITTSAAAVAANKSNEITSNTTSNSNSVNLGFKPVTNIMDGLFPDSPCNDPIDLVPELAPLEPLQDLNDISSILDSNLSAVNINAADNHTSIEDALDFVSEQQANDKQNLNPTSFSQTPSQAKTTINNISHVGFSVQTAGENCFKFYCLLQNCPFLYSSDLIGLETHFMCEHAQIKWNGYCLMCQAQCFPNNAHASEEYPISKEIRHMMEKHANKPSMDLNTDSTQNSNSSSHDNEERPKIKLRRLTGDCLSRATPENVTPSNEVISSEVITNVTNPLTMLGALLVADPKPPTKEMPPQPQMLLTEPLLLDANAGPSSQLPFRNVNSDFLITSVTSAAAKPNETPLQISNVISLNNKTIPAAVTESAGQIQMPKISNVRTLAPKAGAMWTQQIENERMELVEAAAESLEVSRILQNAGNLSANREITRTENDSPVLVAETVPIAQSKTGDFVVTQTISAQYNEFTSTALGFNISIASSTAGDNSNPVSLPSGSTSASVASRQYKCMGSGCKFVSRVPVAMSDHLRFHERRNFSNKQDYLACGFCFYSATDVDDYMKHANQFHIINKTAAASTNNPASSEYDTATSLTKKIHNILNSKKSSSSQIRYSNQNQQSNQTKQVQDTQEMYLRKLRATIDEIVGPTGLADDKLYRCVIKNCQSQLTENTFLSHIMFHITTTGGNPNNYLFKCPHCNAQYHRPAGIKAHIKNHARNRYFCYLCDETSTNPGQILKHFSEKHWQTLNMYTKELLPPKVSTDGLDSIIDSNYYVAYTQDLRAEDVRAFGEKLILEWQRKKSGSKTHFKSSEIDLLPLSAIFQFQVKCGECEYKTKVRTNMFRHLLMHKQNPGLAHEIGASSVVDPVNPVPCLNSNERFFDKMTNLASSSLVPSSSVTATPITKPSFKIPQAYVEDNKRFVCGCPDCNHHTISDELFRTHMTTLHGSEMTFTCPFCKEEVCKRGISIDRIMNHTRFHGIMLYRCDECNYFHHLRYVVERHVNEKHSTMQVNIVTHIRSMENSVTGTTTFAPFAGKRFNAFECQQTKKIINPDTRATNNESTAPKPIIVTPVTNVKGKGRWECDVCGHKAITVSQMQTHCQQHHSVKNQYKCAHCNFGSQQLSHILHHIDEKHSGMTREARTMYHKVFGNNEEVADTRPLWQRNDPTRVRHIRGILMEDEEESEEHRKKLALSEDADNDSNEDQQVELDENDDSNSGSYISGYEFGCYHCSYKTQKFEELREQHYSENHNCQLETAKPFWYRLHRRLCCPDCRSFLGNYNELQQHLQNNHRKRFYAADIKMAENDDTSQRILCGYCSFHCLNAEQLYRHHLKAQHWPQDIRIDNNEQIMEFSALGKSQLSYQCTLCADIFPNRVAIVQHACNSHAGEENFSLRELSNSLIYRCNSCCFTSTMEMDLLRHTIDHYSRFKICSFCQEPQSSFTGYMQHCYAEHKTNIEKFRTIYPFEEIKKFLLQILVIFPSGLVLNKRNLVNTQYGQIFSIYNLYEEIYKISQQPPIPRLSIARLVARKSIEAQQNKDDVFNATLPPRPKPISKRRCTVAFDLESNHSNSNSLLKTRITICDGKSQPISLKRRTTIDQDPLEPQAKLEKFSVPLKANKISKRRSTVAVDRDTLFSTNLKPTTNTLLTKLEAGGKKQSPSPKYAKEMYPLNLDMEPFSFYGKKPEVVDLTKIYTKVAIGGIKTPLTIDKFKLLFNIDCQLRLTKCDEDSQLLAYNDYKHIKKACPASEKLRYD